MNQVNIRSRFLLDFDQEVRRALESLKPNGHLFGGQEMGASVLGWAVLAVSFRSFCLHKNPHDASSYRYVQSQLQS